MAGATAIVRRNHIHDGGGWGVWVGDGEGLIEDNDITRNGLSGISVNTGATATARRNRITQNKQQGIAVWDGGGVFEDNDLRQNEGGAWYIADSCADEVRRRDNQE